MAKSWATLGVDLHLEPAGPHLRRGLTDGFVPDEVYERAAKHFEEAELTQLIAAITVINAWNRFGVTCRMVPGHYEAGKHQ